VQEVHDPGERGDVVVLPDAEVVGGDAALGQDGGGFCEDETCTSDGAAGHLTRAWFAAMLQRIETLALAEISGSRRLIVSQEIQNDLGSHRRIARLVGFRLISGEFVCSTGIGCQDVDVRHGGNIDVEVLQNRHRSVRPMVYIG